MERPTAIALTVAVLVVAVPLGGCLSATGSGGPADGAGPGTSSTPTETPPPTDTPPTTEPTTGPTTTPPGHGYRSMRVEVERVTPADLAADRSLTLDEVDPERRSLVGRLLNRSNHTVETLHLAHPGHIAEGEYLAATGTYYRVEKTVLDRWNVTAHRFELSTVRDPNGTVRSGAVAFENLSAVDRALVREGLPPADRRGEAASFTAGFVYAFENGTVPDASRLADGGIHYVRVEGSYYRIRRTDARRLVRYRVRYEATPASESRAAFAAALVERYVVNASALPNDAGQRDLLVRALDGGEVRWESRTGDPPAAFRALRELLADLEPGDWAYVRHDGRLYRVELVIAVA